MFIDEDLARGGRFSFYFDKECELWKKNNVSSRTWNWTLLQCYWESSSLVLLPSTLQMHASMPTSSTSRHGTCSPMVLLIGSLIGKWPVKSLGCHQQNQLWKCTGRLWGPTGSTRGCRPGPGKDRSQMAPRSGQADTFTAEGSLRSTCHCMFS